MRRWSCCAVIRGRNPFLSGYEQRVASPFTRFIQAALHDFTAKGLLREIVLDSNRSCFDTNTSAHHHFHFERSGRLEDIPAEKVRIADLPPAPEGAAVSRVDVIIRIDVIICIDA